MNSSGSSHPWCQRGVQASVPFWELPMHFSVYVSRRPMRGVDDDVWQRRLAVALGHSASRPPAARVVLALAASGENPSGTGVRRLPCRIGRGAAALARPPGLLQTAARFSVGEQRPDRDLRTSERSERSGMLRHHEGRILARISARKAVRASSAHALLSGVNSVIPQRASIASCTGFDEGMNTNERGR